MKDLSCILRPVLAPLLVRIHMHSGCSPDEFARGLRSSLSYRSTSTDSRSYSLANLAFASTLSQREAELVATISFGVEDMGS